jgi:hypothetical protein
MNELSRYEAARHAPRRVELNGSFLVFSARTGLTGKSSNGSIPAVLAADWPGDGRIRFGTLAQRHQANAALIVIGRGSRATPLLRLRLALPISGAWPDAVRSRGCSPPRR